MTRTEIADWIGKVFEDTPGLRVHDLTNTGNVGVVRWSREEPTLPEKREYIVHRWATVDTEGNPIRLTTGRPILFWSGFYADSKADSIADFEKRSAGGQR